MFNVQVGFEQATTAAITYVVPHVKYTGGDYPTAALQDGKAPFVVDTKVFMHAAQDGVKGTLVLHAGHLHVEVTHTFFVIIMLTYAQY